MLSQKDRRDLSLRASSEALKLRNTLNYNRYDAICPLDAAEKLGIETRILDLPSLEGVYVKEPGPVILLSARRPPGRRAFTCAHEIGHHVFNHGIRSDHLLDHPLKKDPTDPVEFLADRFASYFLMPKLTVSNAFVRRKWTVEASEPLNVYAIASWLGVGYSTLVFHLHRGLNLITQAHASDLLRVGPKQIESEIMGERLDEDLFLADSYWSGRAIDIQVGDLVLVPKGTVALGDCVGYVRAKRNGLLYKGESPGIGKFHHSDSQWTSFVRVSRRGYTGRSLYRHWEDSEE